jgi:hypothetical protein
MVLGAHAQAAAEMHGDTGSMLPVLKRQARSFTRSEVLAVIRKKQEDLRRLGIHSAGLLAVDHVISAIADME